MPAARRSTKFLPQTLHPNGRQALLAQAACLGLCIRRGGPDQLQAQLLEWSHAYAKAGQKANTQHCPHVLDLSPQAAATAGSKFTLWLPSLEPGCVQDLVKQTSTGSLPRPLALDRRHRLCYRERWPVLP